MRARFFLPLLSFLVIALVLRLRGNLGFDLGISQIVLFPLLLLFIASWSFWGWRAPRPVLWLAFLSCGTALAFSYGEIGTRKAAFLMARLQNDEFEIETRIFREKVFQKISLEGRAKRVRILRHHGAFASGKEAARFLHSSKTDLPVIWGNKRWLTVSYPADWTPFPDGALDTWIRLIGIEPVQSVSSFGMSFEPIEDTSTFLALFFLGASGKDPFSHPAGDAYLRSAAGINAGWRSFAHRAYPLWMLGNLHLVRGLGFGKFDQGELRCAAWAYKTALRFIRPHENPDLLAAIKNNDAFVHLIIAAVKGDRSLRRKALKELQSAAATIKLRAGGARGAPGIVTARMNMLALRANSKVRRGRRR